MESKKGRVNKSALSGALRYLMLLLGAIHSPHSLPSHAFSLSQTRDFLPWIPTLPSTCTACLQPFLHPVGQVDKHTSTIHSLFVFLLTEFSKNLFCHWFNSVWTALIVWEGEGLARKAVGIRESKQKCWKICLSCAQSLKLRKKCINVSTCGRELEDVKVWT